MLTHVNDRRFKRIIIDIAILASAVSIISNEAAWRNSARVIFWYRRRAVDVPYVPGGDKRAGVKMK